MVPGGLVRGVRGRQQALKETRSVSAEASSKLVLVATSAFAGFALHYAVQENHMRKVIFGINLTLDGCCDHTKGMVDDQVHEYFTDRMREVDTLVYGRKTYQLMVPFWPDMAKRQSGATRSIKAFADAFDAVKSIVVFSRSLESAIDGDKTRIVRGDLQGEIFKLKQQPGKNISTGGVDIPSQLIQLGLVDEYHLVVHPIFAGEGRRLLAHTNLSDRRQLKLVESKTFTSGCVALHYVNP